MTTGGTIGVIGAGPTGLTAAWELAKQGHRVTVYEAQAHPGGLMAPIEIGGRRIEKFYHHLFTSDVDAVALIDELGLSANLTWGSARNGIYSNDRLHPLSSPRDLLSFPDLSFREKVRLGRFIYQAKSLRRWNDLENMTAEQWVIDHAGRNAYETLWRPLLHGKFGDDAERVSAAWLWNKIKLRADTRTKTFAGERLGYLNGSFALLYETLAAEIARRGASIRCSCPVRQIIPKSDATLDVVTTNETQTFDAVIATVAVPEFLRIAADLPETYRQELSRIKYKANMCVILELSRSLSPYYWISIAQTDSPFVAVVEHTNLVPAETYHAHVVYFSKYLEEEDALYNASDGRVEALFLDHLKKLFPAWDDTALKRTHVHRAPYAQPVVFTDYSKIIPAHQTPVASVYLACMAQIYPQDRGQNYAIRLGRRVAQLVGGELVKA